MKILVPLKRVADPEQAAQLQERDGELDPSGLEAVMNPFDLHALEAALRLTEDGREPRSRRGEVLVVTLGPATTEPRLRNALATGADRALRIEAEDAALDGGLVARALARLVEEERPDLVLMGKQTVDGDNNQVGQRLGTLLDWPVAPFAVGLAESPPDLVADCLVDGGLLRLRLRLPAVVTVDLAIVGPQRVRSAATDPSFAYGDGVRFAPLLAVRRAQQKPLVVRPLAELVPEAHVGVVRTRAGLTPRRPPGERVASVAELVTRLADEAKVI